MSRAASGGGGRPGAADQQRRAAPRYRGVRRRAWGKWVSEIRVPGTRERLWLGSYAAPEAAAVAHDAAACLLRGHGRHHLLLNFPDRAACYAAAHAHAAPLSPRSVQRVASDAGMAADAQIVDARAAAAIVAPPPVQPGARFGIVGVARGGGEGVAAQGAAAASYAPPPPHSSTYCWSTSPSAGGSGSSSAGSDHQQLVYGDISVDDIEILI